jgi:hypothetical protein
LEAVQFLKTTFEKGRSLGQVAPDSFPTQFMPVRLKRYLYAPNKSGQKRLIPDRYEVLVYRQLRNALESGNLFCRDSVRFRSFEDDLISDQDWQDKETVIAQSGLLILLQPIQDHLAALERQLETWIVAVNQRIAAGENPTSKSNAAATARAGRCIIRAGVSRSIIQSSIPCSRWILAACFISSIRRARL